MKDSYSGDRYEQLDQDENKYERQAWKCMATYLHGFCKDNLKTDGVIVPPMRIDKKSSNVIYKKKFQSDEKLKSQN